MPRYFFDIWNGAEPVVDEEGLELPDVRSAQFEATLSLADLTRDHRLEHTSQILIIDVRDEAGPVATARLVWEVK
jgi:hypothetical protein